MISNELYKSLILRYETQIQEYKSTLMIYFENAVGIGDHANHLEEMDGLVSKMTNADDKLNMLKKTFRKEYSKL